MALIDKTSIGTGNTIQAEHITRIIDALNESGSYEIIATGSFTGSFVGDASGLTGITSAATASYAHYAVSASYEINYETSSSYADFAKTASYITLPQVLTAGNATSGNNIQITNDDYLEIGSTGPTWQFKKNSVNGWLEVYNSDEGYNTQIFDQEYFYSAGIEVWERIKFRQGGYGSGNPSGDLLTSITAGRTWTLPDASGTIALTTDTLATASYALTASYVELAQTASYVTTAQTASYIELAQTASYVITAQTASYVAGADVDGTVALATTSSYATTAVTSDRLTGTSRAVITFQTVGATTYTVGDPLQLINASRCVKAIVVGQSTSPQNTTTAGSCGGEFINFYDAGAAFIPPDPPYNYANLLSSTGTLSNNITEGNPQFALTLRGFTATGIANATINWKVILEIVSRV